MLHTHTIFHTQLCDTLSFTHNFQTHQLSHTTLSHTIFLCHTPSFTYNFVTHDSSHKTCFFFSILHHLLCLSIPVPLQHLLLTIGRSWLVRLSGPLIVFHMWWSWDKRRRQMSTPGGDLSLLQWPKRLHQHRHAATGASCNQQLRPPDLQMEWPSLHHILHPVPG